MSARLDRQFRELYDRYYAVVVAWFARRVDAPETARDLAQDTFIRVYRGLEKRHGPAPWPWILVIAKRTLSNWHRARSTEKRGRLKRVAVEEGLEPSPDTQAPWIRKELSPYEKSMWKERMARLNRVIEGLPERARQVVLLRFRDGLTYLEIARMLDISVDTVKTHHRMARRRVRSAFSDSLFVGKGYLYEPELEPSSKILEDFGLQWGNIFWQDTGRIRKVIAEELPAKVAGDQVSGATFRPSPFADLETRLRRSENPADALGATLLGILDQQQRLTLGNAIDTAAERGLSETDAFVALERLARPTSANLKRFYIDRSGASPRLVTGDEVRTRLAERQPGNPKSDEWLSTIEVVWAQSSAKAMDRDSTR